MTRKLGRLGWLPLALLCLALPLALGADKKPPRGDDLEDDLREAREAMEDASRLHMAFDLEAFGRANKSPDALITAGRLLLSLPPKMGQFDAKTALKSGQGNDEKFAGYSAHAEDLF